MSTVQTLKTNITTNQTLKTNITTNLLNPLGLTWWYWL